MVVCNCDFNNFASFKKHIYESPADYDISYDHLFLTEYSEKTVDLLKTLKHIPFVVWIKYGTYHEAETFLDANLLYGFVTTLRQSNPFAHIG